MSKQDENKICQNCKQANDPAAHYCRSCGHLLKTQKSTFADVLKDPSHLVTQIGGMGVRGVSIAPLGALKVEEQSKEQFGRDGKTSIRTKARVHPLDDGSWFCPDCGAHNDAGRISCKDCDKYK